MSDLNFFSGYIYQKKQLQKKTKIIVIFAVALIIMISGSFVVTELISLALRMDSTEMKKYLNSEEVATKKKLLEVKKLQTNLVKEYISNIDDVSAGIEDAAIIKSSLLEQLNATLPSSVYFKSMTYSGTSITMTGAAESNIAVAELQHNLIALGIFEDVHIGSIQTDETKQEVTFDLQCVLKDVIN